VFGFSFGELVVLVVVAIVVIGPKDLPKVLRRLGQWAAKARRMASDLRAQSGIDDVLRGEGIADDLNEIRRLARGELDQVTRAADIRSHVAGALAAAPAASRDPYASPAHQADDGVPIDRQREYPREGADGYKALPDTAITYADGFPKTSLARDPLYILGDPNGALPAEPAPVSPETATAVAATENAEAADAETSAQGEPQHP
jgi:sec-independent protein translocase protein TatB